MFRYNQPHRSKSRRQEVLKRIVSNIDAYKVIVTNTPNEIEAGLYTDKLAKSQIHLDNLKKKL